MTTTSTPAVVAISANQEADQVPEGMVIEKRVLDLLSLLESHTSDATSEIPVVSRPPSHTPPQTDFVDKKRKRDKKKLERGVFEEGMIQDKPPLEQTRGSKATRAQQRRGGKVTKTVLEHQSWVLS